MIAPSTFGSASAASGGQFTELVQGCGPWGLDFLRRLPRSVRERISDGSTILVMSGRVTEAQMSETQRRGAIYEGVVETISSDGLSGWEAAYLMQRPNGDGPVSGFKIPDGGGDFTIEAWVNEGLPANGLSLGDCSPLDVRTGGIDAPAAVGGVTPIRIMRSWLDALTVSWSTFQAAGGFPELVLSWRIRPGLLLDVDITTAMFRQFAACITTLSTEAHGGTVPNIPAEISASRSIATVLTDLTVYGNRNNSTGTTPTEVRTITAPFTAPDGAAYKMLRQVDGGGQSSLISIARERVAGAGVRITADAKIRHGNIHSVLGRGDVVHVYDAEAGIHGDGLSGITHFGQNIDPLAMFVHSMSWSVPAAGDGRPARSIMVRNPNGTFVDLTDYVRPGTDAVSVGMSNRWAPAFAESSTSGAPDRLGENRVVAQRLARSVN